MRIKRCFGALLVASVMCTVFWSFNSDLRKTEFFRETATALERYSRKVEDLWSADAQIIGKAGDSRTGSPDKEDDNEDMSIDIQELVQKLINNTSIQYEKEDQKTNKDVKKSEKIESCIPQDNVVFIKTHKTASSTLTNVFNRYADLRELTVALPIMGYNRFRWPLHFHWTSVDMYRLGQNYANVLSNHARYERASMDAIMELDASYVTILRNPIYQFESTFDYLEFSNFFGLQKAKDPIRRFLRNPYGYLRSVTVRRGAFPESLNLIRNGMSFDLGMSPRSYDNRTLILKAIDKLDKELNLVMIMEYFDESLVLLKRELCWDLEDIVYVKQNQRHEKTREKLTPRLKKMIERWNGADVLLYRHFNKTFWRKIKQHGEDFYRDLKDFRVKNRQVQNDCLSPVKSKERAFQLSKEVMKVQLNPSVSNFDRYFCNKILTNEIDYLKYFRLKFNPIFGYQRQLKLERLPQVTPRIPNTNQPPVVQFVSVSN